MAVFSFFEESLVFKNYKKGAKRPSCSLDQVQETEKLFLARVDQTSVTSILGLCQNDWNVCDARYGDQAAYYNFCNKYVVVSYLAAGSVFDVKIAVAACEEKYDCGQRFDSELKRHELNELWA